MEPHETKTMRLKKLNKADELRPLLASYAHCPDVLLDVDNEAHTSVTMWKEKQTRVVLTNQLVPEKYRGDEDVIDVFFKGEIAHETGHIKYSILKTNAENELKKKYRPDLVNEVANVVDDVWINSRLRIARNVDPMSRQFEVVDSIIYRAWLKKLNTDESLHTSQKRLSSIWLNVLSGLESDTFKSYKPVRDVSQKIRAITENIVTMSQAYTTSKFSGAYWANNVILPICELVRDFYNGISGMPQQKHGGKARGTGESDVWSEPMDISEEMGDVLKDVLDLDKLKEGKPTKDAKPDKHDSAPDSSGRAGYGKGTGLEIPPIAADPQAYQELVRRNMKRINELLRKLPKLSHPRQKTEEFLNRGRMMSNMLGRIYAQTQTGEAKNCYELTTTTVEKSRVRLGLIVDFSGSMSTEASRDALTTISEVMFRWLPSFDFSLTVFGTTFSRIKAFAEPYEQTRYRLGGAHCMSNTNLAGPLRHMIRSISAIETPDPKIIMIFTDCAVDDVGAELEVAKKLGIKVMIIKHGYGTNVKGIPIVQIRGPDELPDAFVKVYAEAGLGKDRRWGSG